MNPCEICGTPIAGSSTATTCDSCMLTASEINEEDNWNQRNHPDKEDADNENADWRGGYRS